MDAITINEKYIAHFIVVCYNPN